MGAAVLLAAPRTYAFLGIADTGDAVLANLLVNSVQQLAKLSETVSTLRRNYDEVRRLTTYAQDAYALAASFQHFSVERFGQHLQDDLGKAYPDAAYYREQMVYGRWSEGGQLAPVLRYCLNGTLTRNAAGQLTFNGEKLCTDLRQQLSTDEVLKTLGATFGSIPASRAQTPEGIQAAAVDAEVAAQLAAQRSQSNRTQRVKQMVEQLEADCAGTASSDGPSAACEAATQRAQMEMLAEHAETNRLIAEQNRLAALQLAQRNADLKRAMSAASEAAAAMSTDAKTIGAESIRIRASDSLF
jgi:hypothetical protein